MEATKFGPQWSLPLLAGHLEENPRQLLVKDGTASVDLSLPYPFLFQYETSWTRIIGKQHFPTGWGGCGVDKLHMALSVASLWEISTHINRAQKETSCQKQLAHIKGAIIKLNTLSSSQDGLVLRQSGVEIVQPKWLNFYSALFDTIWARCMTNSAEGNKNPDVCVIAGRAFKTLADLGLDRDTIASAKHTFELCLLGVIMEKKRLPFERSPEEVKAGGHASKLGRLLISGMRSNSFTQKCSELFERLKRSGWEMGAEYKVQELKGQLNEWIAGDFDNAIVTLPSSEIVQ